MMGELLPAGSPRRGLLQPSSLLYPKAKDLGLMSSGTLPDLLTGRFGEVISAKEGFEVTFFCV